MKHASTLRNLITDVTGLRVGNAADHDIWTGVTVVLPDEPVTAAIDVRGGAPGTRESDMLGPTATIDQIHALVLSGGSAFGLAAATGVQNWLMQRNIGYSIGPDNAPAIIPLVPQAILFDLLNGGNKDWGVTPPYENLARRACDSADLDFALGTAGAGYGATCAALKGGLGSASDRQDGITIGALAAVNPVGQVTIGARGQFWAAPFEQNGEFGGLGFPEHLTARDLESQLKGTPDQNLNGRNTTLAIIATDAILSKAQCHRLAVMAQTGMARAIYPVHTPFDGDTVFALSTGKIALPEPAIALAQLGTLAANVLARAIARGVYEASPLPGANPPSWHQKFG